jgi:enterobactin synthetase component D
VFLSPFPAGFGFALVEVADPPHPLPPEEAAIASPSAVPKRRRELAAGRRAAHQALREAGAPSDAPILKAPGGGPLWPHGWVGAITHTETWAAAAVAPAANARGIGLDLEALDRSVDDAIAELVADASERQWIGGQRQRLIALFSAKEAIFKATFPIAEVFLDFLDARLRWRDDRRGFEAELLRPISPADPAGLELFVAVEQTPGYVMTSLWLPRSRSSP